MFQGLGSFVPGRRSHAWAAEGRRGGRGAELGARGAEDGSPKWASQFRAPVFLKPRAAKKKVQGPIFV